MKTRKHLKMTVMAVCIIILFIACFKTGEAYGAASKVPGTQSDPLVSLSYLEERLEQAGISSYVKVVLKNGRSLYASMGSEVILYSGSAAVCADRGLVCLTSGKNTETGSSLQQYSLYLVPFDGNAVKAVTDCTLYIKGEYTIYE